MSGNNNSKEKSNLNIWYNYGNAPFLELGGCLIRKEGEKDTYELIILTPYIGEYIEDIDDPCIVVKCTIHDLGDYVHDDRLCRELNSIIGYPRDFIPASEEELLTFAVNLVEVFGVWDFDPVFPEETELGPWHYRAPANRQIVSRASARRFIRQFTGTQKI